MTGRVLVLFLFLFSLNQAFSLMDSTYLGVYRLNMEGLSRYGTDSIELSKIDVHMVEGIAGIDWSIGAEARTPMAWEIFYKIPFKASLIHDDNAFHFIINIARRSVYEFTLFPVQDEGDEELLVGYVKVINSQSKNIKSGRVYGVLAEKISED